MSLNLHTVVRQAAQAINQDITATYLQSTGFSVNSAGQQVPSYATAVDVQIQAQPPSGRDLRQIEYLNMQGVIRTVFLYSNPQGINRVNAQGGDLLQFPQFPGAPVDNWLVTYVAETWAVGQTGWSKLYVTLQTDRPPQ